MRFKVLSTINACYPIEFTSTIRGGCDTLLTMQLSGRKPSLFARPWARSQRIVLLALIAANAAAFVAQFFLELYQPGLIHDYVALSDRGLHDAYSWQFITAIFLYSGPVHFVISILLLYFLGRDVESVLGQRHFFYLYLAGALGGEFVHIFLMPTDSVLFAGSGGPAAILVAYATIFPEWNLNPSNPRLRRFHLKAKYLAWGAFGLGVASICVIRSGQTSYSACLGGCVTGWAYARFLGFGRPSLWQRVLYRRRAAAERYRQLTPDQIITEEIDPLLDKISRGGLKSLSRRERQILARAHERIAQQGQTP
jgi:membrane associated rhomboid family serine protease